MHMKISSICLLALLGSGSLIAQNKPGAYKGPYPKTATVEQTDEFFGTKVSDPYRWLEDDMSKETKAWVTVQNTVTNGYMNQIPFRKKIKDRLTALWNYEKYGAPFKE